MSRKPKRQCYIKDSICYIPLSNGQEAICDSQYYNKVKNHNWRFTSGVVVTKINNIKIALHRYIFNALKTKYYIFINKNFLDCRQENIQNRECFVRGSICYIPLNNGQTAMCDADKFDEVNKHTWTICTKNYVCARINNKNIKLHRYLYPEWKMIDHINHNKLDNRSCNLREVTPKQNMMNRQKNNINAKSKYKGVTSSRKKDVWRAAIQNNGKTIYLGCFNNEVSAAEAYNKKAKELFGEYACLNVISKKNRYVL